MTIVSPMGQLRPVFADKNGKRLSGGKVFTYEPGTLTPKATYTDALNLIPNTNPIDLNKYGEADIFLNGDYRIRVVDRHGVLIDDYDNLMAWATKKYLDLALSGFASGASKFYPTLAGANADIANIAVSQIVNIGELENGGLWFKESNESTTLTKAPYDTLELAKQYSNQKQVVQEQYINDLFAAQTQNVENLINQQGVSLQQLDDYYNYLMQRLAQIAVDKGWDASFVVDGDKNQREINQSQRAFNEFQNNIINFEIYNTPERYGADKDAADNTSALQAWLDSANVVHLRPFRIYKFSGTLNLSRVSQSIIGLTHNTYGQSRLQYTGAGTALKSTANIGYLTVQGVQLISQVNTVGAVFDLGTIGIDLSVGGNIDADRFFIEGFETLIKSAGNTFYNKFINCRFSNFKNGLDGFAAYNLQVSFCRFYQFTDAIRTVGGSGPTNVQHNSFEQFNGAIHRSNNDKCHLNFKDNYVEIFDKIPLPVNFTKTTQQTKGDYFGGNILFLGYYSKLIITGNLLSIGGLFRVGALSECDYLVDINNTYAMYAAGNNLGTLYSHIGTSKLVKINSYNSGVLGADGGYTRTYARAGFAMSSNKDTHEYYDWVLNAKQSLLTRLYNFSVLENGWAISTTGGTAVKALVQDDGSTRLMGTITGSSKTANAILTVPATHRPIELGTTQLYILFVTSNTTGTLNPVVLRYMYSTGVLDLYGTPGGLVDIPLNLSIPPRI